MDETNNYRAVNHTAPQHCVCHVCKQSVDIYNFNSVPSLYPYYLPQIGLSGRPFSYLSLPGMDVYSTGVCVVNFS